MDEKLQGMQYDEVNSCSRHSPEFTLTSECTLDLPSSGPKSQPAIFSYFLIFCQFLSSKKHYTLCNSQCFNY